MYLLSCDALSFIYYNMPYPSIFQQKSPKNGGFEIFFKIFEKFLKNNNGHPVKIQRIRRIVTDIQFKATPHNSRRTPELCGIALISVIF